MEYNISVHFKNDPLDYRGTEEVLEFDNIEEAKKYVLNMDNFYEVQYFVIEDTDTGYDYYNSEQDYPIEE